MRKSKYTESQIIATLKEVENGMMVADVCRQHGIIPGQRPYTLQRANYDQHELFAGRFGEWR